MKKLSQLSTNSNAFINYIGLIGVSAFFLLNLAALLEYGKYTLGITNHFIDLLPAIKLIFKIDFIFMVVLIFLYNAVEKVFNPKILYIGIPLVGIFSTIYMLVKNKPLVIIAAIGLYGLGIYIYTSILGFALLISKGDTGSKVNYDGPKLTIEQEAPH